MKFLYAVRGWIFYLLLSVTIMALAVAVLPAKLAGCSLRWRYERLCRPWAKLVLRLLKVSCGVDVKAEGMENMPDSGPVVVLSKHQSAWDPFWLGAFLKQPACFLYKRSLHRIPVLGWIFWSMEMLAVDRSKGRTAFEHFMETGPEFLKRGWWICLFPEGTRVPPGEHVRYKTGGARFACATGTPILPVAHTAGTCWPKNSVAKIPGTIRVSVGPLLETRGRDPHEVTAEVEAWIEAEVERLYGEHETR